MMGMIIFFIYLHRVVYILCLMGLVVVMGFLCGKCMVFKINQLQATIMNVILISCSNMLLGMIIYLKMNGLNCTISPKQENVNPRFDVIWRNIYVYVTCNCNF